MHIHLPLPRRFVPADERDTTLRRNMGFGIANGILFSIADAFSDTTLVLTVFISQLGASPMVVGLLPALKNGGWLLPQLISAGRLQGLRYKLPVYRNVGITRSCIWLLMTLLVWFSDRLPTAWLLLGFMLGYALYNFTGGAGSVAFQEVVAKTIPARKRGFFFGTRNMIGGLLAFALVSPIVAWVLSRNSGFSFPHNFALLLSMSFVFIIGGITTFASMKEPPTESPPAAISARNMFAVMPNLIRGDHDFRRYVISRIISRFGSLADPFYILYAREVLHVPTRMIGLYLALRVISAALSNVWWARIADRHGNRALTVWTGWLLMTAPLWALSFVLWGDLASANTIAWLFGGVFLLIGLCTDGAMMAGLTYVMELAPVEQRTLYVGVSNTLMGIATFAPVLGGILVKALGYEPVFAIAAILAGLGAWSSMYLPEPRKVSKQ